MAGSRPLTASYKYEARLCDVVTGVLFASGSMPYGPQEEERYRRTPVRHKPIMIPVDQPPPPRDREYRGQHRHAARRKMSTSARHSSPWGSS